MFWNFAIFDQTKLFIYLGVESSEGNVIEVGQVERHLRHLREGGKGGRVAGKQSTEAADYPAIVTKEDHVARVNINKLSHNK